MFTHHQTLSCKPRRGKSIRNARRHVNWYLHECHVESVSQSVCQCNFGSRQSVSQSVSVTKTRHFPATGPQLFSVHSTHSDQPTCMRPCIIPKRFSPADGTTTSTYASSLPDHYPLNFVFWVRKACNMYELSTLRLLVVVHIFEKINPVDLGNIPMSHRKIIRVSDARLYSLTRIQCARNYVLSWDTSHTFH